jgi:uncharacterized protein (DUF305 family)
VRQLALAAALMLLAVPAMAQSGQMNMSGGQMSGMQMGAGKAGDAPSTTAYKQAMDKMHHGMMVPYTGNADRDFVAGMIPHHQGAVEMAQVELKYGTDPDLRKLAQDIVAAQEKEIAFMKAWQAKQH